MNEKIPALHACPGKPEIVQLAIKGQKKTDRQKLTRNQHKLRKTYLWAGLREWPVSLRAIDSVRLEDHLFISK
ncbi:MAG: hypothetical protein FWD77_07295 [Betaproteobacteria bacterium]|nr:hypothetical protein [Betaproteobacteria bacterium]